MTPFTPIPAWCAPDGFMVRAGDTVRYMSREGMALDAEPEFRSGRVLRFLVFDDHVQVSRGSFGNRVDASNFVRLIRRGKESRAWDAPRTPEPGDVDPLPPADCAGEYA